MTAIARTGGYPGQSLLRTLVRGYWVIFVLFVLSMATGLALAQETTDRPPADQELNNEYLRGLFSVDLPEGFKLLSTEEPGIFRWKKGQAEISVVVGELFAGSPDYLFKALTTAGEENKRFQEVKAINVEGARAIIFKEKAPQDSGKLRSWRLMAINEKRCFSMELSSPEGDFPGLTPEFEKAVASFKLKGS